MSGELSPGITFHVVNTLGWPDLRPLQRAAIEPVRAGRNALLVAPTAGGKTEAAMLPLLSEMAEADWRGLSVLYLTPLRALLNNLHPRLGTYAAWVGRRVGLWHGDIGQGERRRTLGDPPDILLTTPESIEAMLVSTRVDHRSLFADLRAVVVDELHAFAGDDRGWHLLAVLERLQRLAGRPLQRLGMTATVGNPAELLDWLTRSGELGPGVDPGVVVAPEVDMAASPRRTASPADADVALDYVGTVANAATVIQRLHPGEKRLVFCQSRAQTEALAAELRGRDVPTVVSHSSLSADERRLAERTFAEASDCVVVATSTLELGIDIGDLDRVVQLDAPSTVASFLQRLGRTGRRPGTRRNMLFLATTTAGLLQSAALLSMWRDGFVEPVVAPPQPAHIAAQQLLALGLQEGRFDLTEWRDWWPGLEWMQEAQPILQHLLTEGFLGFDAGFAIVGDASERRFGRRNFLELTSVFAAAPELTVLAGRTDVGSVSPLTLASALPPGVPRVLSLAGRAWRVTHVDWPRRRVYVAPAEGRGKTVWSGGSVMMGPELAAAIRDVLLGHDPDVVLSQRAVTQLATVRASGQPPVDARASVLAENGGKSTWWTFAGSRANLYLAAALESGGYPASASGLTVSLDRRVTAGVIGDCLAEFDGQVAVDAAALRGLKFADLLPPAMARDELVQRMCDPVAASAVGRPMQG